MTDEQQVYEMVFRRFTWQNDMATFGKRDYFKDFYAEVKAGLPWRGDCDDFALTCLVVGIKDFGWQPHDCTFLDVATPECPRNWAYDHHIAKHGDWYFDNIQRHAVDYFPASYVAFAYQDLPLRPDNRKLYESGRERLKYL